jgi:uncharacterized damage-inducible protein DinB
MTHLPRAVLGYAVLALLPCSASSQDGAAQQPKRPDSIGSSVLFSWGIVEYQVLSAAEAMPEEKYSFAPTGGEFKDARTFGQQLKHVACANFAFFNEMEGKTPPPDCERGGPNPAKTKAELLKYLRDSFAYGDKLIPAITPKNALDPAEGRYAAPNTRLGLAVIAVWHGADHYGQMVLYLRMCGIVPPASRPEPPPLQVKP